MANTLKTVLRKPLAAGLFSHINHLGLSSIYLLGLILGPPLGYCS